MHMKRCNANCKSLNVSLTVTRSGSPFVISAECSMCIIQIYQSWVQEMAIYCSPENHEVLTPGIKWFYSIWKSFFIFSHWFPYTSVSSYIDHVLPCYRHDLLSLSNMSRQPVFHNAFWYCKTIHRTIFWINFKESMLYISLFSMNDIAYKW